MSNYGLIYLSGTLLYAALLSYKLRSLKQGLELGIYLALGTIIGGRLLYVLCYDWTYYRQNPLEIIEIYRGGMSFHGAALGITLSALICGRCFKRSAWFLLDQACLLALILVPCGRIINFINGELWGKPADWGLVFAGADQLPRHPVQLYEALAEGPVIALIIYLWARSRQSFRGALCCRYAISYCLLRFILEFWREPDAFLGYVLFNCLSLGQILCVIGLGISLALYAQLRPRRPIKFNVHRGSD